MKLQKYLEFKESDLDPVKSFKIQDNLNSKVWNKFEINSEIRENLLKIGEDFYSSTDLEAEVIDIVLCGSLCNYNWSEKYSDYDLHIIIHYEDIDDNNELVSQLCDLSKKIWNQQHDIQIKGYDVEVAIQDEKDLKSAIKNGRMGGVYSLMKDKWIKKPEKVEFEPDESLISEKAKTIMLEVDDIIETADELEYDEIKLRIKKVWDKIKKLRERALEEEGEFGIGNLVFKLLRRNNYLSKIMDLKRLSYDKQFESINEEYTDNSIIKFLYDIEEIDNTISKNNYEGWSQYINFEDLDEDMCEINLSFGASGYSDGWSENWKINWKDPDYIIAETDESSYGPYDDGPSTSSRKLKFNSFEELLQEIKEHFGL